VSKMLDRALRRSMRGVRERARQADEQCDSGAMRRSRKQRGRPPQKPTPPPNDAKLQANFEPKVRLVWWDDDHMLRFKVMPWRRPCTGDALTEWMANYFQMVREGYLPKGFAKAPMPHCARVYRVPAQILAEWHAPKVAKIKTA